MRLIKKVEIHYLRSLYKLEIKSAGDLNLVFGRNDSGKSNLLRALNLFFNGKTELTGKFDFDLEMSDIRKEEAREVKGKQFIWIKITFAVPPNYQSSLGNEVEVKRQWNRGGELTETIWPKKLAEGNTKPRLTRFLNDIDFTYIPAIKDLSLHADLIERLYAAAAQNAAISAASAKFVDSIGKQTTSLTRSLTALFGSESTLSPPTEMGLLFRNLDFAYGTEKHSMIRQKGDGVKARHIPEILRFINENEARSKFYIWGFEEPENSLDLNSAQSEANRFAELSGRVDTQIFLTSHSPAFYLSDSSKSEVKRFFVRKQASIQNVVKPTFASKEILNIDDAEMVMESAGLLQLPFVIRALKEMPDRLARLEKDRGLLEERIKSLERPTLFLEGKYDIEIFTSRMADVSDLHIRGLGGTPNTIAAIFTALADDGKLNLGHKSLIVFDNDPPGRKAVNQLMGNAPIDYTLPNSVSGQLSVMCLPYNSNSDFCKFVKDCGLQESEIIFEAEFLFDPTLASSMLADTGFDGKLVHEDYYKKPQEMYQKLLGYAKGTPGWLFSRTVPDQYKASLISACLKETGHVALDFTEAEIRKFFEQEV